MNFQILYPAEALRPYITRYVYVRAEGSTDTMSPPEDSPRFVNGKHVQPLLPNYGSFVFMRNVVSEIGGKHLEGLTLLGANQQTIGLTTVSGWFEGLMGLPYMKIAAIMAMPVERSRHTCPKIGR
ncbi:MAG: hypothetical protein J5823_05910 [Paludibacteraceae bacterium]|nr:hypothetical protein [Paludibacteraceae bacterium]